MAYIPGQSLWADARRVLRVVTAVVLVKTVRWIAPHNRLVHGYAALLESVLCDDPSMGEPLGQQLRRDLFQPILVLEKSGDWRKD